MAKPLVNGNKNDLIQNINLMTKREGYYSVNEMILLVRDFCRLLVKKWLMGMVFVVIGAGVGFICFKLQKPKYKAEVTFILEEKSGNAGGSLAGLASQFGVNLGGMGSGAGLFAGDNILDILKSKKIIKEVLLSNTGDVRDSATLIDMYLDFMGRRKGWEKRQDLAGIRFRSGMVLTPLQDSVLNLVYQDITEKYISAERTSKQGSIIKVQVTAENPIFARLAVERIVAGASNLYYNIRTGNAQANIDHLQHRSDSILSALNGKSYAVAASQPLDINPGLRTTIVPTEIGTRDKTVLATLYAEVIKNLEASKLILSQQSPVIQLLDSPDQLLDDNKRGFLFFIVVFGFVAGLIYTVGLLAVFVIGWISKRQSE